MLTREEIAEKVRYCKENGVTYKSRLKEIGISEWRFYESKRRYAEAQASERESGEFLQLVRGNDSMRYWLYNRPTDMRKSYYTLSGIVTNELGCDPCNGDVYIFMNKSRNRIKLLHWEPGGLVLYCKLLESG